MVHSNAILIAILELQGQPWKQNGACILIQLERFVTSAIRFTTRSLKHASWHYMQLNLFITAENMLKTRTVNSAFWRHLKRFVIAEKNLKTRTVNGALWRHLKQFRTTEIFLKTRTIKWCILTVFETLCNCRQHFKTRTINGAFDGIRNDFELQRKQMKSRTVNGIFWRYLKLFGTAEILFQQGRFRVQFDTFETAMSKTSKCFDFIKGVWSRPPAILERLKTRTVNGAIGRYLIPWLDLQRTFWKHLS